MSKEDALKEALTPQQLSKSKMDDDTIATS